MIKVESLTKSFGKKVIIDHISFSVNKGEVFGLLGPNAAGKTTTIRLLGTVLKPDSGIAVINGFDITKNPIDVRKIIGILPEDVGLYDRLTPKEMLNYYGQLHEMSKGAIVERTEILFEKLELNDYANVRCSTLSKGTKQKVSIAQTLLHDPPVLFLDEPTAGVDVLSAIGIKDIIMNKIKEERTIILSTHNMTEVEKMCNRLAIINGGRIITNGTLSELKEKTGEKDLENAFVSAIKEDRWKNKI